MWTFIGILSEICMNYTQILKDTNIFSYCLCTSSGINMFLVLFFIVYFVFVFLLYSTDTSEISISNYLSETRDLFMISILVIMFLVYFILSCNSLQHQRFTLIWFSRSEVAEIAVKICKIFIFSVSVFNASNKSSLLIHDCTYVC